MAKPICVIYWPDNFLSSSGNNNWIYEYMRFLNGAQNDGGKYNWDGKFSDYHWFCFHKYDIDVPEFKVFYPQDMEGISVEELKELVLSSITRSDI